MGALTDYINQLEAEAQIAKSKMWSGVENAFVGFENYLSGKKSDFYGGQPTEEQMRLKRQQIKDQYIQATQEMRDRENPPNGDVPNEEMLRLQRQQAKDRYIQSVESAPQTRDSFYIYPEDEARKAAIQQQAQAGAYSPYGMGTVNFAGGQTPVGAVSQIPDAVSKYLVQAGTGFVNQPEPLGPPVPAGFQYQQPSPAQTEQPAAPMQGPLQEPPMPQVPTGWQPTEASSGQVSAETAAALTPEERFAVAQGYTPARAEAVHPAITSALNQASARVAEITKQPGRKVETTPVVNAAFEEMLKMAPEELRPMFRSIKIANSERAAQQQSILQNTAQQIEVQRRRELASIDAGVKSLPPEAFQYDAVKYDIDRAKALAERKAALNAAELSVYGMEPTAADNRLKNLKDEINKEFEDKIKPFDTTPQYKGAMAEKAKISEKLFMHGKLFQEIKTLEEYVKSRDVTRATQFAKSTVAQTMNSLINSNAIQLSEMLIRYPGLLTADEKSQLAGKGIFDVSNKVRSIFDKSDNYKLAEALKGDKGLLDKVLKRASDADPMSFIASAIDSANANARALNSHVTEFIEKPTSDKIAGIKPIPEIDDSFLKAVPRPPVIKGLSPEANSMYQYIKSK